MRAGRSSKATIYNNFYEPTFHSICCVSFKLLILLFITCELLLTCMLGSTKLIVIYASYIHTTTCTTNGCFCSSHCSLVKHQFLCSLIVYKQAHETVYHQQAQLRVIFKQPDSPKIAYHSQLNLEQLQWPRSSLYALLPVNMCCLGYICTIVDAKTCKEDVLNGTTEVYTDFYTMDWNIYIA